MTDLSHHTGPKLLLRYSSWGLPSGLVQRVTFDGERLAVVSEGNTASIRPQAADWQHFCADLDALGVWRWREDYHPQAPVLDGHAWALEVAGADGHKRVSGNNAYPGSARAGYRAEDEPTPAYVELCRALSRLTGGHRIDGQRAGVRDPEVLVERSLPGISGKELTDMQVLMKAEGGTAWLALLDGRPGIYVSEWALADILDGDDEGISFASFLEFATAADRATYAQMRGWPPDRT